MIISKTPLRISLLGGGTDFHGYYSAVGGTVVSMAINKYIHVIIKDRYDDLIVLNYTQREVVNNVHDIKHEIIKECLIKVGITKSIEITTLADIPSTGSGLGSSSTVTVGLLNALFSYIGESKTPEQLAVEACDIEINRLNKPIGKQDQYIAAYGGFCKINFNIDNSVNVAKYRLTENMINTFFRCLLLNFTNITRSANNILSEQKSNIEKNFEELNQLKALALECDDLILNEKFHLIGDLLNANWFLKKGFSSQVTNETIESIVELALKAGSVGTKIAGAGGGGFVLSYVPFSSQEKYREMLCNYKELRFDIDPLGSRIVFNNK
jgi:D-glycero-alpha-D-manno-heptose-7-phosphate kinase